MRNSKTQQMIVRQDKDTMDDSQISPNVSLFNPDGTPYRPEGVAELDLSELPDPSWLLAVGGELSGMTQEEMVDLFREALAADNDFHSYLYNRVAATGVSEPLAWDKPSNWFTMDQNATIAIGSVGDNVSGEDNFHQATLLLDGEFTPTFTGVTWLGVEPTYETPTLYQFFTFGGPSAVVYGRSLTPTPGAPGQINHNAGGSFGGFDITPIPHTSDWMTFGASGNGYDITVPNTVFNIPNATGNALVGVLTLNTIYNMFDWPDGDDADSIVRLELQINALLDEDPWESTDGLLANSTLSKSGSSLKAALQGNFLFIKEATIPPGGIDLVISYLGNIKCSLTPAHDSGELLVTHTYSFIGG